MLCIISDSEIPFSSQFSSPLFISSHFPSKPLLEIVGKGEPNSLHMLLATKIPFFFFCIYLSIRTVRRNGFPKALALSPRSVPGLFTLLLLAAQRPKPPSHTLVPLSSSPGNSSFIPLSQQKHHLLKVSLLTLHPESGPLVPCSILCPTVYLILHSTKQDCD